MPPLAAAAQLIAKFEGFRSEPYLDSASIPTIGYGTIRYPDDRRVTMHDPAVSHEAALAFLEHDLTATAMGLWKAVSWQPTVNEWSALVSLAYNIGVSAIAKSTVLRLFNAGDRPKAAAHFSDWSKAHVDGKLVTIKGLLNRRVAEAKLFLTPDNEV